MIVVVIAVVLTLSYASSLRAYLVQRSQLDGLQADIAASQAAIEDLEQERERLEDPAYITQQARERLGMVRPGETPFVVLEDGRPLQVESQLTDPSTIDPASPPPWWEGAWESVRVAGNPPRRADPLPETLITDPDGAPDGESGSGSGSD